MVKVAQSYEMVRNFNNFKSFYVCGEKLEALLVCAYVAPKNYFDYTYVSLENFFDLPPVDNIFGKNLVQSGQNPRKCWSKHDDTPPPPPPNVDGFATSLCTAQIIPMCITIIVLQICHQIQCHHHQVRIIGHHHLRNRSRLYSGRENLCNQNKDQYTSILGFLTGTTSW